MFENDKNVVLTLDAGGTNFVFGAMQGGKDIAKPLRRPSNADNLDKCLGGLIDGFRSVMREIGEKPSAISFAFPGPADYARGIIGDLPNFPSFRGGIALGPMLQNEFNVPVFINNDGSLFAYGEALAGVLPEVNDKLRQAGSSKQYRNLLGLTLGTGFGAGVVIDGKLLVGDNGVGGDIWCFRNKLYPNLIAEEGVSIRAVKRVYREVSGSDEPLEPKDICDIADGKREGSREAALAAFDELGQTMGDAVAMAVTIVDGLIVIGGGLAGAHKYIVPAMLREMNSPLGQFGGNEFPRLQMRVYNLDDEAEFADFVRGDERAIAVPGTDKHVPYDPQKRIGVAVTRRDTSKSVALGAYAFALNNL